MVHSQYCSPVSFDKYIMTWPSGSAVKSLPALQELWIRFLGQEDPLEKGWQPTAVFLPGKFHGQRILLGYLPWDHKVLDMTKHACVMTCILCYSIIQNYFPALNICCVLSVHHHSHQPLSTTDFFYCLHSFAFSRMLVTLLE